MQVIILAGGSQKSTSTIFKPRPLFKIRGKFVLQHQIDLLEKYKFNKPKFSLGFMAEPIINYLNGNYPYIVEHKPLGTGGAIKFASQNIEDDFMVLNGDILSDINLKEFVKIHQLYKNTNNILASMAVWHCEDARNYGLIKLKEDGQVLEFKEKPTKKQHGFINAGVYILSPKIFDNIQQEIFSIEKEIFPKIASQGKLGVYIHEGQWVDAGNISQ